ncbi:MAG TPA: hypothetical protein VGP47_05465 [Parachlamydiaceae bacterium]|nr:hypothetical protein [Parachlamydiaceae bacterium]
MLLTIAERLRPFSHLPGTAFVVPGTTLSLEIFPALIRVTDLALSQPVVLAEISLDLNGPVKDFTAVQDLENGSLRVFGTSVNGYFRYSVRGMQNGKGIIVTVEKTPSNGMLFHSQGLWVSHNPSSIQAGEKIIIADTAIEDAVPYKFSGLERLSLGSHKLQDWELVRRRLSFDEIFPIWFRLGQMVPQTTSNELTGTALLLKDCHHAIAANAPEKILSEFSKLFIAGFDGVLSPRLTDTDFNGIKHDGNDFSEVPQSDTSALTILSEGARLIRSLFIREEKNMVHVLPSIPPEFHCGRMLDVKCEEKGLLSLEWTKKSLRCMTLKAQQDQTLAFTFSNHEKKCRLRTSTKDKGITYIPGEELNVIAGQDYWFDNFQR